MVVDRWLWIRRNLKKIKIGTVIDIGCGTGTFTLGAAKLGFNSLGLSWDAANQQKAINRSDSLNLGTNARFDIQDVRNLHEKTDYLGNFDVAICCETIEHILNDRKLIHDIKNVLKQDGTLLLTSPNIDYIPIGIGDEKGTISLVEDGGHVRVGYSKMAMEELFSESGLDIYEVSYCSGFLSQKLTGALRILKSTIGYPLAWLLILPFRLFPLLFDRLISQIFNWPGYSICVIAKKR